MHDRIVVKRYMKWNRYWCFGRVYKLSVQQINYTHSLSLKFGWWIYFWFGILVCWICFGLSLELKKKTKKQKRNGMKTEKRTKIEWRKTKNQTQESENCPTAMQRKKNQPKNKPLIFGIKYYGQNRHTLRQVIN